MMILSRGNFDHDVILHVCLVLLAGMLNASGAESVTMPGKWDMKSRLRLSLCYDETAVPRTGSDHTTVDTMCTTVAPGVTLRRADGSDLIDLGYDFRASIYEKLSNRDLYTHRGRVLVRQRMFPAVTGTVDEKFTYSFDSGGEQDEAIARPSTYADNEMRLGLNADFSDRVCGLLEVNHEKRVYADHYFDNWSTVSPGIGVEWQAGRTGRLSLRQEFKHLNVENSRNAQTREALFGYACALPWELKFDVQTGILTLDDHSNTDPSGSIRLSKRWPRANVTVRWEREASVSSGTSRVIRRDHIAVQPGYLLGAGTEAVGRISLVEEQSIDDDCTDTTTWRSGVALCRKLTEFLTADLGYTYVDQDSRGSSGTTLCGSIISIGLAAVF